jgi:hypothetical protein
VRLIENQMKSEKMQQCGAEKELLHLQIHTFTNTVKTFWDMIVID